MLVSFRTFSSMMTEIFVCLLFTEMNWYCQASIWFSILFTQKKKKSRGHLNNYSCNCIKNLTAIHSTKLKGVGNVT